MILSFVFEWGEVDRCMHPSPPCPLFPFPHFLLNFFLLLSFALFLLCESSLSPFLYANEVLRLGGLEGVIQVGLSIIC